MRGGVAGGGKAGGKPYLGRIPLSAMQWSLPLIPRCHWRGCLASLTFKESRRKEGRQKERECVGDKEIEVDAERERNRMREGDREE